MGPRNRYVCYSDFALMTSAQLHWSFLVRRYHMKITLLELLSSLMFLCHTLKHHIWSLRFFKSDHLNTSAILQFNQLW